jgi:SWI/SNF-related matrix-associated actin-dependent regulator of chromatin subfamily A3
MSAKRREETIRRFSKPVVEDVEATPPAGPGRTRSRGRASAGDVVDLDDNGSDFVMDDAIDDDDFLDDSDDESAWAKRSKKGKGKAKAKPKANPVDVYEPDLSSENPRVMLISLKGTPVGQNPLYRF